MTDDAAAQVLELLVGRGATLATAESLTGGRLAARITAVPGASRAFLGGVVSYATGLKVRLLGVPDEVVAAHGVVSRQCAEAMARGVAELVGSTWAVSTTGVAGPDRQEGRPAGTVFVAVAGPEGVAARELALDGDRPGVQQAACDAALGLLLDMLRREEPALG